MPRLGLGLGLSRGSQLKTFAQLVKSAGGVLYLDARKADGSKPLTGNQSPFKDLSGNSNDGTLTNFAGTDTSGWNEVDSLVTYDDSVSKVLPKGQRIVDGVVDLKTESMTSVGGITCDQEIAKITTNVTSGAFSRCEAIISSVTNTLKTIKCKSVIISGSDNARLRVETLSGSTLVQEEFTDETLRTITFTPTDGGYKLLFFGSYGTDEPQEKTFEEFRLYEGNTEPTSGVYESGNSRVGESNVLRFDGVDDFVAFADTASLDITNAPLAIGVTFKKPIADISFLNCKGTAATAQYGMFFVNANLRFFNTNTSYAGVNITIGDWENIVYYWDGINVTSYRLENGVHVQKAQTALTGPLITAGVFNLGRQNGGQYSDFDIGIQTIYTGSDINKILKAEAKISAEYLALNP